MYRQILVPVDHTEMSKRLLTEAAGFASGRADTVVTILHVGEHVHDLPITPGMPVGAALVGSAVDVEERSVEEAKRVLAQSSELLQQTGVRHESQLRFGNAATEICRYAEDKDMDLIVIGRKDKGAIERFLLGSVSQAVVQNAPCNVMVVSHC